MTIGVANRRRWVLACALLALPLALSAGADAASRAVDLGPDFRTALTAFRLLTEIMTAGKPIPPDVVRRVRERGEKARAELLATHGVQDIGVAIIRELRGLLPE